MDSEQKRLFLAVVLSAIVLFGWQVFFAPPSIEMGEDRQRQQETMPSTFLSTSQNEQANLEENLQNNGEPGLSTEIVTLDGPEASLKLSSDLIIKNYQTNNARFLFSDIVGHHNPLEIFLIDPENNLEKLYFTFDQNSSQTMLMAKNSKYNIGLSITRAENQSFLLSLTSPVPFRYRLRFNSTSAQRAGHMGRQFISFSDRVETYAIDDEESVEGHFRWLGVDFNYHLFAAVFEQKTPLRLQINRMGQGVADLSGPLRSLNLQLVFTRKDYDLLESYNNTLHMAVDFGIFGVIGVPILRILQWFYRYIPNYGVGIILLTLLLRIVTFPLQHKSFKSMKKMQQMAPEIQKIREKFKDDPQKMQQQTMALFKKSGANPLSGCFPLLLQMPILFAFYQVLYNAVELVGAPFVGWIVDLSEKDPFYVLPVLCTLSMFLHQKMTPSAISDPTQKKIMLFMPFVFGIIMKDLPSGLVLYIVVSTLLGIVQQMLVYKLTD